MTSHAPALAFALILVGGTLGATGCADESDPDYTGPRGDLGKTDGDIEGSCAAADACGEAAPDGNCWCDDECLGHGDCCSDKAEVCPGGVTFATFNAGLAHGAVPFADERIAPIAAELAQSPADVLCLSEVWTDADAAAIKAGVAAEFPYSFRERTINDSTDWFACGAPQWPALYRMNSCVSDLCTPDGISAFECAADQCAPQWNELNDTCKLCLAANPTSPLSCAAWRAPMFGNEGRNGLLLLSRRPLENPGYAAFETQVIKRGFLHADVAGFAVQCTHLTADLDVVPYPEEATFSSWSEEQAAQVDAMAAQAGTARPTVLLGDLNAGPPSAGVDGELPANFKALVDAGYRDTWTDGAVCTFCGKDNPLSCSRPGGCPEALASRIDHVLIKSFPAGVTLDFARFADAPITIVDEERVSHPSRLSDHYGVIATMPY